MSPADLMKKVQFDWTINVSQLIAIITFIGAGFSAWYNLKTDIEVNKTSADLQFKSAELFRAEIKDDLRDLHYDVRAVMIQFGSHQQTSPDRRNGKSNP
jgi:hypothetical protein